MKISTILKSPKFTPLFIAQFFGAFNDNVFKTAFLIFFTYEISLKSGANAGFMNALAALLFILPFFLFSYFAGKIADKYDKSNLVRKIKFAEIILMSATFFAFHFQNQTALLALLFLMGAQSAMFGPLKYSLPKILLKENELLAANSLIESSTFLAILFGTIFGAILIRKNFGIEIVCVTLVFCAIIGYLASLFIKTKNEEILQEKTVQKIKISKEMLMISWFWFLGSIFLTQFPIFARDIIKGDEKIVSLFLIIFSIAIAFGSIFCAKIVKNQSNWQENWKIVRISIAGISLSIAFLYFSSLNYQVFEPSNLNYFLKNGQKIMTSLFFTAFFAGIYVVILYTKLQIEAKKQFIARIIAMNNILNALFMVIASIFMMISFKIGLKITEIFLILAIFNLFWLFFARNNKN